MIANANELEIAFHNLQTVENALDALRKEMQETNPALFPIVSQTYTRRIRSLQEDIFAYLRENPADAPLKVRLAGASIPEGTIRVGIVARLLQSLQSVLLQEGKAISAVLGSSEQSDSGASLKALLGLNLVATQTGSFILALDLAPRQLNLFEEYDIAERALTQMLGHIAELTEPRESFSGSKAILRSLDKIASLIKPDKLSTIEFAYRGERMTREATFTSTVQEHIGTLLGRPRQGEETVKGMMISIDIEKNTCHIRPEGEDFVSCHYADDIEDDLILAVKKQVEVSGQIGTLPHSERRSIRLIERMRVLNTEEDV